MTSQPSFQAQIKPLFREEDQKAMEYMFDLWDYEDVKENAQSIYDEVKAGGMPCDGAWPEEKVNLFRSWMDGGMPE